MLRKFNTGGGLLSLEESVIVENGEDGVNVTDDQLFDDAVPQELPQEAKDILVYFTDEKAREISEAGPTLALESFWNLITDIESIRTSVRQEGGVSQALALECERLMPGFLNDDYPVKSFSQIPTRTNLNYTAEAFDVKSMAIIGAIIAVILGIAKLMFGSGDSSSSGSGGGSGVADKVEDKMAALKEAADKAEKAMADAKAKAQLVPNDINVITASSFKLEGISADDALKVRLADLNEHCTTGLNGLQAFAFGVGPGGHNAVINFWNVVGKGHYTDAVITMNQCLERINQELKLDLPDNGNEIVLSVAKTTKLKVVLEKCFAMFKGLALFSNIPFDPVAIIANVDAAKAFYASDPTLVWLAEFDKLKATTISAAYTDLLNASLVSEKWTDDSFFFKEFDAIIDSSERRTKVFKDLGKNATVVIPQLLAAFKTANSNVVSAATDNSADPSNILQQAVQLCEFIMKVIRNLARIYHELTSAVGAAVQQMARDVNTMADVKMHNLKASAA